MDKYDGQIQSSNANDLSKFIYPTFIEDPIKRITIQAPQPRIWVLTEGGLVYILSYQRQEEYYTWSKIDHGTTIEHHMCKKVTHLVTTRLLSQLERIHRYNLVLYHLRVQQQNQLSILTDHSYIQLQYIYYNIKRYLNYYIRFNKQLQQWTVLSVVANGFTTESIRKPSGNGTITMASWSGPTTGAVTVIGRNYTGTVQPMYPTWDGQSKPAFGADEIRVVSTRLHVIKTSKFKLGIGGTFETITPVCKLHRV